MFSGFESSKFLKLSKTRSLCQTVSLLAFSCEFGDLSAKEDKANAALRDGQSLAIRDFEL